MRDYNEDLKLRETVMEEMRLQHSEELAKKDKEKNHLKSKLDDQGQFIKHLEYEMDEMRVEMRTREERGEQDQQRQRLEFE